MRVINGCMSAMIDQCEQEGKDRRGRDRGEQKVE